MHGVADLPQRDNLILYTAGSLADRVAAKTAWTILRFQPDRVKAVLDPAHAGRPLADVCPTLELAREVPIVAALDEIARAGDTLVVGCAPNGGALAPQQREELEAAARSGLVVLNGLHERLDAPSAINLRAFHPADRVLATGREPRSVRVLTIGTSGGMGKLTTTVLLSRALGAAGVRADWLPTGQTGVMLRGFGHVLDSVPLDFAPGVVERDLATLEESADVVVVEGQGALRHPSFGTAGFVLAKVCRPQWFVVCHRLGAQRHTGFDQPVPPVREVADAHRELCGALGFQSRALGVALDSADATEDQYERERQALEDELGVPCRDPVRDGAGAIGERLAESAAKPLSGSSA